jgi:hypothetical protein
MDMCYRSEKNQLLVLICTEQCYVVRRSGQHDHRVLLSVAYRELNGVTVSNSRDGQQVCADGGARDTQV